MLLSIVSSAASFVKRMGRKRDEEIRMHKTIQLIAAFWLCLGLVLLYLSLQNGDTYINNQAGLEIISKSPPGPTPSSFKKEKSSSSSCSPTGVVDWTVYKPETLNLSQIIDYVEWTNSSSCRLTHDFGGHIHDIGMDGQKAVCMDPEVRPKSGQCLVYSFGISHEWSFDEAMEQLGCEVFAFDPSMGKLMKDHNHTNRIHFYNIGLSNKDEVWESTLTEYPWKMHTLESIYKKFGHQNRIIDYLKVDIEHSEWTTLPHILSSGMMDRVRQLAVEIHLPEQGDLSEFQSRVAVLKSLEVYGLMRFDSKYNPWSVEWNTVVDYEGFMAYELAWWNKKLRRNISSEDQRTIR